MPTPGNGFYGLNAVSPGPWHSDRAPGPGTTSGAFASRTAPRAYQAALAVLKEQRSGHPQSPRIVLIHRYFFPDSPPYAHILSMIAEAASEVAPTVVLTGNVPYRKGTVLGNRREIRNGVQINRLPLLPEHQGSLTGKALNSLIFAVQAAVLAAWSARKGVVMAATTPPIVVSLTSAIAARLSGSSFVYHNQDIYPEVLGTVERHRGILWITRIARRLDTFTGKLSTKVVVLSQDMKSLWIERGVPEDRILVLNNTIPPEFHGIDRPSHASRQARLSPSSRLRAVYVGNVGPIQALENSLRVLSDSSGLDVEIYGGGRSLESLKALGLANTQFFGPVNPRSVPELLRNADLGVVSLQAGAERAAYPSKVISLLSLGVPLLAFIAPDSSLADEIRNHFLGYVIPLHSPQGSLREALDDYRSKSAHEREEMRNRCQRYAVEHHSAHRARRIWMSIFQGELGTDGAEM